MRISVLAFVALIVPLAASAATPPSHPSFDCKATSGKVEIAICSNARLSEADAWLANVYKQRLAAADVGTHAMLVTEQHGWLKQRDDCIERDDPNRVRQELGGIDECLYGEYDGRIASLEQPLRHFVDVKTDAPAAANVCAAARMLKKQDRWRLILRHALPMLDVSGDDLTTLIAPRALEAAAKDDEAFSDGTQGATIIRVPAYPDRPDEWVVTFIEGSLLNPSVFIFDSSADGKRAEKYVGQIGTGGTGYFDTYFIRFKGRPFVVTHLGGQLGVTLFTLQGENLDCK